jgi:VanZ family protein
MRSPGISSRTDRTIDAALWAAGFLFAGVTLVYSLAVMPPQGGAFAFSDKWLHAASYFATGLCLLLAGVWRPGRGDGPFVDQRFRGAIALIAAGALIEVIQALFTSRQAEVADLLADVIGVIAALFAHSAMRRVARGRRKTTSRSVKRRRTQRTRRGSNSC